MKIWQKHKNTQRTRSILNGCVHCKWCWQSCCDVGFSTRLYNFHFIFMVSNWLNVSILRFGRSIIFRRGLCALITFVLFTRETWHSDVVTHAHAQIRVILIHSLTLIYFFHDWSRLPLFVCCSVLLGCSRSSLFYHKCNRCFSIFYWISSPLESNCILIQAVSSPRQM